MFITWLGHSCFKLQSKNSNGKEIIIVTDPYESGIGLHAPRAIADIVTVSHDHFDHNNVSAIKGEPFVISSSGEYEIKNVFITGVPSHHDQAEGKERGSNVIYRIEMEGMSIVHLGDLGHILTTEQLEKLEGVDILMIPVGGKYTLNAKEAAEVVKQVEPRIVMPMHYKIKGLKVNIETADKFLKEMGDSKPEKLDKFKITKKDLPQEEIKVVVLSC